MCARVRACVYVYMCAFLSLLVFCCCYCCCIAVELNYDIIVVGDGGGLVGFLLLKFVVFCQYCFLSFVVCFKES